jgi:hypothetical protein
MLSFRGLVDSLQTVVVLSTNDTFSIPVDGMRLPVCVCDGGFGEED